MAAAELAFGVACALTMIVLRSLVDLIAPTSGPFAMMFPTVLIATLFGHMRAGLTAWVIATLWAWYFVLPYQQSFAMQLDTDAARVVINAACGLVIIGLAESFRRAVRLSTDQLSADADRRLRLLAELEHRTKNNFALVASLLEIQMRRHTDPVVVAALKDASCRVMTFADAYTNLAAEQAEGAEVDLKPYLQRLIERLAHASFPENVKVIHDIAAITLPREDGVAVGLYLNEALANCAKYAFPNGQEGSVEVRFDSMPAGWTLCVRDNGVGKDSRESPHSTGLGRQLMQAFADQAGAIHAVQIDETGCCVTLSRTGSESEISA